MAKREVTISVRVEGDSADATARRLNKRFSEISDSSDSAGKRMQGAFDGLDRSSQETIKHLQEIIKQFGSLSAYLKNIDEISKNIKQIQNIRLPEKSSSLSNDALKAYAMPDISQYQKSIATRKKAIDAEITASDKALANILRITSKQTTDSIIQDLGKVRKERLELSNDSTGGNFVNSALGGTFLGAFIGGGAAGAAGAVISKTIGLLGDAANAAKDLSVASIRLSADFEVTTNSMAVFTGSLPSAQKELSRLADLSDNTTGLSLRSAEEGATRLRALQFEAKTTDDLLVGLSKHKILSGADNGAVDRVIVNLTQLQTGSPRMSQDIKEMILSMPTLRRTIIETFGSVDKFKKSLAADPDQAFAKFAKALADTKAASGGLNNDIEKLTDQVIRTGREFGMPILDPLSESVRGLTGLLKDNRSEFGTWGQYVGDIIQGLNETAKEGKGDKSALQMTLEDYAKTAGRIGVGVSTFGASELIRYNLGSLEEKGKTARLAKENSPDAEKKLWEQATSEINATYDQLMARRQAKQELARKAELDTLQATSDERIGILKNGFDIEQARRDQQIRYTVQDEKKFALESGKSSADFIRAQISQRTEFYNKQFSLADLSQNEIVELTSKKNKEIGDLNAQLQISEFQTAKKIQDYERQILEQRRQSQIEFKQLQLRDIQQGFDTSNYDTNRTIDRSTNTDGFTDLIVNSQKYYNELRRITKENYDLRLTDLTLSTEQIKNIQKEAQLEEIRIREEGRRATIEIEERKTARLEALYRRQADSYINGIKATQEAYSVTGGVFSAESFDSSVYKDYSKYVGDIKSNSAYKEDFYSKTEKEIRALQEQRKGLSEDKGEGVKIAEVLSKLEPLQELYKNMTPAILNSRKAVALLADSYNNLNTKLGENYNFDKARIEQIGINQAADRESLNSQIKLNEELKRINALNAEKTAILTQESKELQNQKVLQGAIQQIELARAKAQSTQGRKEKAQRLANGDAGEYGVLKDLAEKNYYDEITGSYTEIYNLKFKIANTSDIDNLAIEKAYLEDILEIRSRETASIIQANRAQLDLANSTKFSANQVRGKVLSSIADEISDINSALADGIVSAFQKGVDYLDERLGKLGEIPILGELLKFGNRQFMSKITIGLLDTFLPDSPFTDEFKNSQLSVSDKIGKSNEYLKDIRNALTGKSQTLFSGSSPSIGSTGGGWGDWISNALSALGGGSSNLGNRRGINSASIMNLAGSSGFDENDPFASILAGNSSASSGGFFSNLLGAGGIFGEQGFGNNTGTYGAIGAGAGLLGSLVGGRFGGLLSGAGSGLGLGAQIGSIIPGVGTAIGAGVGAVVGGLIGLFTGGTRKQDEQARTQAYLAVSAEFDKMIDSLNSRPPGIQPSVARSQADSIIAQYNSAMNQLKDSKTRRIALQEVTLPTGVIYRKNEQLNAAMQNALKWQVDDANRAKISSSFTGEFNTGVYADFNRYNGLLPGTWSGRDYIKALLADEELVLNRNQRLDIIAAAGYDVFSGHGIPNYPNTPQPEPPKFSTGMSYVSSPVSSSSNSSNRQTEPDEMNFSFDFGDLFAGIDKRVKVTMSSKTGKKIVLGHVKTRFNGGSDD